MSTFESFLRKKNKLEISKDAIEIARLKEEYCEANKNDLLDYLYEFLRNKISSSSQYDITLNLDYVKFYGKISLLSAIHEYTFKGIDYCYIQKFKDALLGKNSDFRISFNFKHTIFDSYIKFDNLHCEKLIFENTVFNKGARLRFINVTEIIYEPKHLGGDVTFANKYFDKNENQIIDLYTSIETFTYRHQITGSGFTFFVGINFTQLASFTNSILDRVQFSNMNLSGCLFINSKIDKTRFYNCVFEQAPNIALPISKDKPNLIKWYFGSLFIVFLLIFLVRETKDIPINILATLLYGNVLFMLFASFLQTLFPKWSINKHFCVHDEIRYPKDSKLENYLSFNRSLREVYRQLKINFQKNEDYQMAGDFYYSQRYIEITLIGTYYETFSQWLLLNMHHWINGFGERWVRPIIWMGLTIWIFMSINTPNKDYISTPSTPVFLLQGYNQQTGKLDLNESNISIHPNTSHHFLNIANTTYMSTPDQNNTQTKEKIIFAYDNVFDYHYSKQMIPMIRNDIDSRFLYSISHFAFPFMSDQKQWFQTTNSKSLYLSTIETILLWFFFGAFVLAIKNRIKR